VGAVFGEKAEYTGNKK